MIDPHMWQKPYEARYGVSRETVVRIRAAGVDLDKPDDVEAWIASRQHRARAKKPVSEDGDPVKGKRAKAANPVKPAADALTPLQGAQHALRRLEVEESRLHAEMIAATGIMQQAERRKAWLATLNELKKFDMLVEAGRRDSGEVITRAQMQPVLLALAVWLRRAVEDFINSACLQIVDADSPQAVCAIVGPALRQSVKAAIDAATIDGKLPDWVRRALLEGL